MFYHVYKYADRNTNNNKQHKKNFIPSSLIILLLLLKMTGKTKLNKTRSCVYKQKKKNYELKLKKEERKEWREGGSRRRTKKKSIVLNILNVQSNHRENVYTVYIQWCIMKMCILDIYRTIIL